MNVRIFRKSENRPKKHKGNSRKVKKHEIINIRVIFSGCFNADYSLSFFDCALQCLWTRWIGEKVLWRKSCINRAC